MRAQVRALRKVLPQQSIRVLIRAALPWAARIAEVDVDHSTEMYACMLRDLRFLIPRQRAPESLGQGGDHLYNGVAHRLGTRPSQYGKTGCDPQWNTCTGAPVAPLISRAAESA
jgi:hypothetical protein